MIYSNNKMYSLVTHAVYKGRDIAENIHYPRYTQAPGVIYISHYKIFFFYFEKNICKRSGACATTFDQLLKLRNI